MWSRTCLSGSDSFERVDREKLDILCLEELDRWSHKFNLLQWSQMFVLFVLRFELQTPFHRVRVIAGICVEDKFKETGSDKEMLDLANNDRFIGDTRRLMILVMLVVVVVVT
jgi:hypothetical protein